MGRRTNTVLQTCFFALSGVLSQEEAIKHIKKAIDKTYGKKGEQIVRMNYAAVDAALAGMKRGQRSRRPRNSIHRHCASGLQGRTRRLCAR